ncbi:MAG: long-chain fatty acid--CoA ligase [Burkholderiales bacterium]|nr:long-chain fatty acid--CoA ligase [Burkholderiales bacterium]
MPAKSLRDLDLIPPELARTLDGLLRERLRRSPDAVAYRDYNTQHKNWRDYTWAQIDRQVARWQAALTNADLQSGDTVALMVRNSIEWIIFDQAAIGLGLVVVPLYMVDRAENAAYVMRDAGVKLLFLEDIKQWRTFTALPVAPSALSELRRVVCRGPLSNEMDDARLIQAQHFLPDEGGATQHLDAAPAALATIIYTSGTTGRPKGVMLSHNNILSNAYGALQNKPTYPDDVLLSFLPLSHTLERTAYYGAMMAGATIAFARSVNTLGEDLQAIRPTELVSVPRVFERIRAAINDKLARGPGFRRRLFDLTVAIGYSRFEHEQGRARWQASHLLWPLLDRLVAKPVRQRFGGRLRNAVSGGAALSPEVARTFLGLGIPLLQGYGLTETSPVVCSNTARENLPASIGKPIPGVEIKIGEQDVLLVKGPNVMLGYWNNPDATAAVLSSDGWLNTGDKARVDSDGYIFITGRLKEIIVLSNGEKVPPVDMEAAVLRDPLFEQVLLVGEGQPYLGLLAVLNGEHWAALAGIQDCEPKIGRRGVANRREADLVLARVAPQIAEFPGYAKIRRVALIAEPWTVDNGMLTPTLKLKRAQILERHRAEVEALYSGHD